MRGIADDRLIEIADLDRNAAVGCGDGPEITGVTITANPDGRSFRQRSPLLSFEPFVKLDRASPDIGVGRTGHLQRLLDLQNGRTIARA